MGISVRGLIIYIESVLLIKRRKKGQLYYVLPGGHLEDKEEYQEACIREVYEETGLRVNCNKKLFSQKESDSHTTIYYLCSIKDIESILKDDKGLPFVELKGEEIRRNCDEDSYKPLWMSIKKIKKLTIYPIKIKGVINKHSK